ncbi:hypothetical protein [Asticcacaulis solisilvae]|uniref:hypothetical protein n=1 Tax=Asticcacaulis solisilvae TaxID=1217274 RepID=UPI003FD71DB2
MLPLAVLAAAAPTFAALQSPPAHTGDCAWVHGRYVVANGSGIRRIWIIGTHRVVHQYDDDEVRPETIRRYETVNAWGGDGLYGDFQVCALEKSRPGHMQHVRITATRRLSYHGKPF